MSTADALEFYGAVKSALEKIQRQTRTLAKDMTNQLDEIDKRTGSAVIDALIEDIRPQFDEEVVQDFIDEAREALLERIPELVHRSDDEDRDEPAAASSRPRTRGLRARAAARVAAPAAATGEVVVALREAVAELRAIRAAIERRSTGCDGGPVDG